MCFNHRDGGRVAQPGPSPSPAPDRPAQESTSPPSPAISSPPAEGECRRQSTEGATTQPLDAVTDWDWDEFDTDDGMKFWVHSDSATGESVVCGLDPEHNAVPSARPRSPPDPGHRALSARHQQPSSAPEIVEPSTAPNHYHWRAPMHKAVRMRQSHRQPSRRRRRSSSLSLTAAEQEAELLRHAKHLSATAAVYEERLQQMAPMGVRARPRASKTTITMRTVNAATKAAADGAGFDVDAGAGAEAQAHAAAVVLDRLRIVYAEAVHAWRRVPQRVGECLLEERASARLLELSKDL